MAVSNGRENFKQYLVEAIKIAGETLIENAEDIAGNTEYMTHLSIDMDFDPEMRSIPEINITRSHVPSKERLDRLLEIRFGKEGK